MTLLTENQLDKYMEKFSYQLLKEFENENMNKSYNYFIFLSRHKNELMQNHISLEAILYTTYSVFTKFLQGYEKNIQKDAGLEQQHYNLIQDIEREIGTVDWDLLQKIEKNAWTGYGAAAEALGFVLLAVGAAFAGRDPAGHLIADVFCVSPELDNLVPQAKNVNLKQYREIEREWEKALKKVPPDNITDLKIEIIYDGNNVRPNAFNIKYKKNGRVIKVPTIYN